MSLGEGEGGGGCILYKYMCRKAWGDQTIKKKNNIETTESTHRLLRTPPPPQIEMAKLLLRSVSRFPALAWAGRDRSPFGRCKMTPRGPHRQASSSALEGFVTCSKVLLDAPKNGASSSTAQVSCHCQRGKIHLLISPAVTMNTSRRRPIMEFFLLGYFVTCPLAKKNNGTTTSLEERTLLLYTIQSQATHLLA